MHIALHFYPTDAAMQLSVIQGIWPTAEDLPVNPAQPDVISTWLLETTPDYTDHLTLMATNMQVTLGKRSEARVSATLTLQFQRTETAKEVDSDHHQVQIDVSSLDDLMTEATFTALVQQLARELKHPLLEAAA